MAERIMKVDNGAYGVKDIAVDLPSNSHKTQTEKEKPKNKKIIQGTVVTRKKSLMKRFSESFLGAGAAGVIAYVLYDVLVPAAKSTVSEMVSGGIEMLLFGDTKGSRTRRDGGRSYVSYDKVDRRDRDDRNKRREPSLRNKSRHEFDDVIIKSRGEAEEVLSTLVDIIEDYGMVSVSDLYDLVGITSNFTDNKYGWINLSDASVSRVRDGYLIDLPRTMLLD